MPTGYTACIGDKDATFEEYLWGCARAFGALILMRDDPADAPIPERFEPSDSYAKWEEAAREKQRAIAAMSDEEAAAASRKEVADAEAYRAKYVADHARLRRKYEAMLAKVADWQPPTPEHVRFKEFMAEQIQSSIKFDCGDYMPSIPPLKTGRKWKADALAQAAEEIARNAKGHAEEVQRTNERNEWVDALRASVKLAVPR
jgi:hypothetical protein